MAGFGCSPRSYGSWETAVDDFVNEGDPERVRNTLDGLKWLIGQRLDDVELHLTLLRKYGSAYYALDRYESFAQWLTELHNQIAEHLGKPKLVYKHKNKAPNDSSQTPRYAASRPPPFRATAPPHFGRFPPFLPVVVIVGILCLLFGAYLLFRQSDTSPQGSGPRQKAALPSIQVAANRMWTDSGISLVKGDEVEITASGSVNIAAAGDGADKWIGPDGWGNTPVWYAPSGERHNYAYQTDSLGALRGKVGQRRPFKVGSSYRFVAANSGVLYLGVEDTNDSALYADNRGAFTCTIQRNRTSAQVTVLGTDNWKDSGLVVAKGQSVRVSATGSVVWDRNYPPVGPNGTFPANTVQQSTDFPIPSAGCGSLVMKIGSGLYAVGDGATVTPNDSGAVMFMVNDRYTFLSNNSGSFAVRIEVF